MKWGMPEYDDMPLGWWETRIRGVRFNWVSPLLFVIGGGLLLLEYLR